MGISMNRIIIIIVSIIIFATLGCNKDNSGSTANCAECYESKPDSSYVFVSVTINNLNPLVPVELYEGAYTGKNQVPIISDTIDTVSVRYLLPVNKTYSAKATYQTVNKVIYSIDGESLETHEISDMCPIAPCWAVYGGSLKLELKNY
jgi:hypothetical protein